jgi:signal transduction histidine kinase
MSHTPQSLAADIEKIQSIQIVPLMLDVICQSTGMGFAAIARVTTEKWIVCSVRDDINFGLQPGGELQIETTICDEIQKSKKAVIIDHVAEDDHFRNHHTPLMYGFQSYISIPIVLKTGEFFGTLCAIDPKPALLNNEKTIGMFKLFAELISFHLQSIDLMEQSKATVTDLNRKLTNSIDENRQYHFISNHNLQEPLRKVRLFSDMLVTATENNNLEKAKEFALKINSGAQKFSMMIKDLSGLSELNQASAFENVDLSRVVEDVCKQLHLSIGTEDAVLKTGSLPFVHAVPIQMEQLFYHLIHNAVKFAKENESPRISISSSFIDQLPSQFNNHNGSISKFVEIKIEDHGIGIEKSQLEKIFDIFARLGYEQSVPGAGIGLAYCRKIIRNHGGEIRATSEPGKGTAISLILPKA